MNRIREELLKLSDKFHKMEKDGVEFTEAEDELWMRLTDIIEHSKEID
jgi:hypothetical protein